MGIRSREGRRGTLKLGPAGYWIELAGRVFDEDSNSSDSNTEGTGEEVLE
jgi:hypothetical protein